MTMLEQLVDRFLKTHLEFHPVDATFMGLDGHDHRLPPADPEAIEHELGLLLELRRELLHLEAPTTFEEQLEYRMLSAQIELAIRELQERPRYHNPAWYTGEIAFGLVSLMLPSDPPRSPKDFAKRLGAIPKFLRQAKKWLGFRPVPADWTKRAILECKAILRLLGRGIYFHTFWSNELKPALEKAALEVGIFMERLEFHPDTNPACGEAYLSFLMREVHGLPYSPAEAEAMALQAYQQYLDELNQMAGQLNPQRTWQEQLAELSKQHPALEQVIPTYEALNQQALEMAEAAGLVTTAGNYGLSFQTLPAWALEVVGDLYFLFYRSPPAGRSAKGSLYWVFPPGQDVQAYLQGQSFSTIKITHVVHHGSIGHHTQNAGARASRVKLGQIAGTDCASGIAFLSGGTMIEGWACYAQDLMLEAEGFYTPQERLALKHAELRNAAMCLADIRLHRGVWTLEQMRDFYHNQVGMPAGRVWSETTRNSVYPATRLMYWLGTKTIKDLRREYKGSIRAFHDHLLSFGSVPVHWIAPKLRSTI
jgi:hypothetical protein